MFIPLYTPGWMTLEQHGLSGPSMLTGGRVPASGSVNRVDRWVIEAGLHDGQDAPGASPILVALTPLPMLPLPSISPLTVRPPLPPFNTCVFADIDGELSKQISQGTPLALSELDELPHPEPPGSTVYCSLSAGPLVDANCMTPELTVPHPCEPVSASANCADPSATLSRAAIRSVTWRCDSTADQRLRTTVERMPNSARNPMARSSDWPLSSARRRRVNTVSLPAGSC